MIMCYDGAKTVIRIPGMGLCVGLGFPTTIYKLTHIWFGHMDYTETSVRSGEWQRYFFETQSNKEKK